MKFDMERVSGVQHEIWSHWMKYLFSVSKENLDGSFTISKERAEQWKRQCYTAYENLSEKEKESDREQALKVLDALSAGED